ncbi:hypothetical protein TBLA_0C02620 [Henningerozyma blattae CBS 6284]|uniref:Peptidase M20 dimerisation domain-containing protein n=1 Tax=Henningerozyma blattae (strain ATCC 34711 / CBS 6284 / DSM 70876 / NBRC 10599 / NRRL Y-10934 / UCD 77-7) TaxID=1071380 RepID=I2H119_HENB6|nr:hypothetical protein TBLA_0C02620 [Tetrapisispora blattae CBS 6284]CCH60071.1 hypothetical protein TBLA_0C02620 [Tetrapisispora blattae CBS 6284]
MQLINPVFLNKWNHEYSILSLVAYPKKRLLFAGTQDSKILVFNLYTYNLIKTIQLGQSLETNISSSVLYLTSSEDENYLFSASADSLVRVWSIGNENVSNGSSVTIQDLATIYSITDIGDIFSLRYLDSLDTLVLGCQDASLLYLDKTIERIKNKNSATLETDWNKLPHRRYDKFFDSKGPTGTSNPTSMESLSTSITSATNCIIEIPAENIIKYAHNGFIYSICKLDSNSNRLLNELHIHDTNISDKSSVSKLYKNCEHIITGGGDGLSKIWMFYRGLNGNIKLQLQHEGMDNKDCVLSQAIEFPFLYCGLIDGYIKIWDLNTKQLISALATNEKSDIISISVYKDHIFAINESGITLFHDNMTWFWNPNQGKVFTSDIMEQNKSNNSYYKSMNLLTGGDDGSLTIWNLDDCLHENPYGPGIHQPSCNPMHTTPSGCSMSWTHYQPAKLDTEDMIRTLKELVAFKTVSQFKDTSQLLASRRCAVHIQQLCVNMGAEKTQLIPTEDGKNPLVFAHFKSNSVCKEAKEEKRKKIIWYGHYDVISAGDPDLWKTAPFELTCEDGYMKGRGVSDNKGPIVAAIYSVATLFQQNNLANDVYFLIEGNEETGSQGLKMACEKLQSLIGDEVDWILLSNSTWIDRKHPCMNYGLRGVINAKITVTSDEPNRHSGVDGGVHVEPAADLIYVISKLRNENNLISIPNFYDSLKPLSSVEQDRMKQILEIADFEKNVTLSEIVTRWTKPSLSITTLEMSGPGNITVIPKSASIGVSIRLVPEQSMDSVKENFVKFLEDSFKSLNSPNHLKIYIVNEADAWLGDPTNHAYSIISKEIENTWNIEPLFVREGGSIPCIRTLEKLFKAPAVQIPCGQSTDNAHLDNENLRIKNFTQMAKILSSILNKL